LAWATFARQEALNPFVWEKTPVRNEAAASSLVENMKLLKKPSRLRSRALEADFRLFLVAAEIGMGNAGDLGSLSKEF
jgi:hypothetical protein